ncbi:hypothetical protein F8388_001401 [Cannabis sativa]|uniref:Uncharacterized protein n=1 Tax=Cannabis sativa TaxID=3483 RepID=A0A7J6GMP5_CANSA|nr:hypothetical protein F8388_001401 [Cannabis sativa]
MAANAVIVLFFLLITEILLFSISTAQHNNTTKMISLDSSISPSTNNSYWLSNSGQFAFGFYKQDNGFAIGIWFDKIKEKTVIWTANWDQQQPLPQSKTLALIDFANSVSPDQPAASASMLDSGNFVLYNSESQIIWQSFDHPTDTLLPGQSLESGKDLISAMSKSNHSPGRFHLVMQLDGNLVQYPKMSNVKAYHAYWNSQTYGKGSQNVTLNFDANGNLYMYNTTSSSNIKTFHSVGWGHKSGNVTYRLTIDADGILRLYSHKFYEVLWENNSYSIVSKNNRIACEQDCLKDCQCEIAVYTSNTCNKLRLPLRYAKPDQGNSDVVTMVKVLNQSSEATTTGVTKGRSERVRIGIFISSIVLSCFGLMALAISIGLIFKFRMWEYRKIADQWHHDFLEDVAIRPYTFGELEKATEARGMAYLHEECETQIIHCDIKPENILMDEQACAKIADFGLSKLLMPDQTRTYTGLRGTRGYWAPEWHRNMPITVKVDVYSYGIMLLEIVCCRRSVDMDVPENEVVLANWVYDCFVGGEMGKLVHEEDVESNELKKMIKLGLWCIQDEPSLRPSMKKVCMMLEGIVDIPTPPIPSSSISVVSIV